MGANFTPSREGFTDIGNFRFWCQKVIPLVYDDSLSYYELLCKVVDYLNKTIDNVNNLNVDVTSIYEAYNLLQQYVNDYFDNLDVQEEINNKLDELVSDGTLEDLLKNIYGDRLGVEIVDSTTDMVDITKVYILASDQNGYLWFWNGENFEESTINYFNPINALGFLASNTITDLNNLYRQVTSISTDKMSNVLNTPPTTRGILVIDYSTNNRSSVQIGYNFGNYSAPEFWIRKKSDGVWSEWFYVNTESYIEVRGSITSGDLDDDLFNEIVSINTDHIGDVDNLPPTNRGIIVWDVTPSDKSRVQLAINYANDDVPLIWCRKLSALNEWSQWYELTGNYWVLISNGDLNDYNYPCVVYWVTDSGKNITNNPMRMGAGYCKTSFNYLRGGCVQELGSWANNFIGMKFIRTKQSSNNDWSNWNIINADYQHNSYGFTVIGDSLSSGVTTRTQNGNNSLASFNMESWEKILANKIGCKVYSCSKSGASTVDWLNENNTFGITKFNRIPITPIYCINLGINDCNQEVGETVFKNNYRTIINTIKTKSANSIIFCFKLWRDGRYDEYSYYIDDIMSEYSNDSRVILFDIQDTVLSSPISLHSFNGHYSVIGYKLIADAVEVEFMNIANNNPELFRYEFSSIAEGTNWQSNGYPYVL